MDDSKFRRRSFLKGSAVAAAVTLTTDAKLKSGETKETSGGGDTGHVYKYMEGDP